MVQILEYVFKPQHRHEDGYFTDTKLNASDVAQQIRFFGTEEPMPEPCFRVIAL